MDWNRLVIESRKDKHPSKFKDQSNRAGQTIFVQPDKVLGTLTRGYEAIMSAATPANRAALAMLVIAAIDQRFYHWRHKFGFKFVETVHAPEDDDKYDVFYATSVVESKENIPFEA